MLSATEYGLTPTSGDEWQLAYRKSPNENPERNKIFFLKLDTQIQCQKNTTTGEYLHDIVLTQ